MPFGQLQVYDHFDVMFMQGEGEKLHLEIVTLQLWVPSPPPDWFYLWDLLCLMVMLEAQLHLVNQGKPLS